MACGWQWAKRLETRKTKGAHNLALAAERQKTAPAEEPVIILGKMKIVIQNNCAHIFSRQEIELIIEKIPKHLTSNIGQLVLYQGQSPDIYFKYYNKENILGFFVPKGATIDKSEALEELLIALSILSDMGHIPNKISQSKRKYYLKQIQNLKNEIINKNKL